MGLAAKILTAIGALILLGAGGCFLFVNSALSGGAPGPNLAWIVGVVLIVAGVVTAIAFFGMFRKHAP